MIDLKDFMKATLQQITDAAREFQEENEASGAKIMPKPEFSGIAEHAKAGFMALGHREYATVVNFDVAITVDERESASAGGGIKILPFRVEGETGAINAQQSASRIKFPVTLYLPQKKL